MQPLGESDHGEIRSQDWSSLITSFTNVGTSCTLGTSPQNRKLSGCWPAAKDTPLVRSLQDTSRSHQAGVQCHRAYKGILLLRQEGEATTLAYALSAGLHWKGSLHSICRSVPHSPPGTKSPQAGKHSSWTWSDSKAGSCICERQTQSHSLHRLCTLEAS